MTTQEAAEVLGVIRRRVLALIKAGKLKATKRGRDWWIEPADLDALEIKTKHRKRTDK